MTSNLRYWGFALCLALFLVLPAAQAAPFKRVISFQQPDGVQVQISGQGDEFYAVFENAAGYTALFDSLLNAYCFARLSPDGRSLVSTGVPIHLGSPIQLGLRQHLRQPLITRLPEIQARRAAWEKMMELTPLRPASSKGSNSSLKSSSQSLSGVVLGTRVGLTLLVDFMDVPATVAREEVERFCNQPDYHGFGNNGSVRDYYYDNSGGLLTYTNVVTVYLRVPNRKSWYCNVTNDCGAQGQMLVRDALEVLTNLPSYQTQILPALKTLTSDSRGRALACNVFYTGGNGGVWSYGLWPHSSALSSGVELWPGGKKVWRYQVSNLEDSLELGTFCHENGHMLCGYPDVYDYDYDSSGGAGFFCLMDSGSYGGDSLNPVQICAYLKLCSGWATLTDLCQFDSIKATLTAFPQQGYNHLYRFLKPGTPTEYFLLENRHRSYRDADLPAAGIAIWHIDELGDHNNQNLLPNSSHANYEVTLVQADNRYDFQRNQNNGDEQDLFYSGNLAPGYSNRFSDDTLPSANWWDGSFSGLAVSGFDTPGPVMSLQIGDAGPPQFITQPLDLTAALGQTVRIQPRIQGAQPLNFQWTFQGTNLPGAQSQALSFALVSTNQSGLYQLVVSNAFGTVSSSATRLDVVEVSPLALSLNLTNAIWTTEGQEPWRVQRWMTHDGSMAVVSGQIADGQNSSIKTQVQGPGGLSFWWKVSSEASFDKMRFLVDGAEVARFSGEIDWTNYFCNLAQGWHTLQWSYEKDQSLSAGSDCVWLDQVAFSAFSSPKISLNISSGQVLTLGTTPVIGATCVVEYKEDLSASEAWHELFRQLDFTNSLSLPQLVGQTNRSRFYRIRFE